MHVRDELRSLLKQLALPSIIVTHDWAETLTMGDVMAVISAGDVLQVGPPIEVFSRPKNADVARVVGIETVVKGRVIGSADGMVRVNVNGTTLTAVAAESEGSEVFVCIRSEDVVLERGVTGSSARNHLVGTVTSITLLGALARVTIDCDFPLVAMVTRSTVDKFGLVLGVSIGPQSRPERSIWYRGKVSRRWRSEWSPLELDDVSVLRLERSGDACPKLVPHNGSGLFDVQLLLEHMGD